VPPGARGGRLVSITLVPPKIIERGADSGVALRGTTTVRMLGASFAGWLGDGGVTVSGVGAEPGSVRVAYALTPQRVGLSDGSTVDLKLPAGQYAMFCFFPDPSKGDMPHALEGMIKEFTVTA
jgi:hypothetical protein